MLDIDFKKIFKLSHWFTWSGCLHEKKLSQTELSKNSLKLEPQIAGFFFLRHGFCFVLFFSAGKHSTIELHPQSPDWGFF
jgi:hypothetical protein